MTRQQLINEIKKKKSFLCVGLDTDIKLIPEYLLEKEDPVYAFNKEVIDNTKDHAVAYKINTAFYEVLGSKGWDSMEKTLNYIPDNVFTIADAKRGDIGNTGAMYARAFFERLNFDSITVAPYMGRDSVQPFLDYAEKWSIVLALTSNPGSQDFQILENAQNGETLFKTVINKVMKWGSKDNTMFVVGATNGNSISEIRKLAPDHFLLVPGVGAQGGSLKEVADFGINSGIGLLVNSSRGIIYQSNEEDFGIKAGAAAKAIAQEMQAILQKKALI